MYILFVVVILYVNKFCAIGVEKKGRGEYTPVELTTILGEFNERSLQLFGENERKAAVREAELEFLTERTRATS